MTTEQIEELSKGVFGSGHMLTLMAEIARSETGKFSTPGLASSTGLPTSSIHTVLARLKRTNLIRRTSEVTAGRIAIYERRVHPTWEYVLQLKADADAQAAGTLALHWASETRDA